MIVMRYTFQIKPEKWDEALKLAMDGRKNIWPSVTGRIYSSNIGPMNTIVIENEFEDMAAQQKHMGQIVAKEEWDLWVTTWWDELITGTGTNEV